MSNSKCRVEVDASYHDYDAHGRFYVSAEKACGCEVFKAGRCRSHFESHLQSLIWSAEFYERQAAEKRREHAELTDATACVGEGQAACASSA